MLCQLVCVDRRYQRMNCFNIRELQGILKRKFFPDLINLNDHRFLMDSSMIGLRFKSNSADMVRPEQSLFYNFGITNSSKHKNILITDYVYGSTDCTGANQNTFNTVHKQLMLLLTSSSNSIGSFTYTSNIWPLYLNEILNLIVTTSVQSLIALQQTSKYLKIFLLQNIPQTPTIVNWYGPINT